MLINYETEPLRDQWAFWIWVLHAVQQTADEAAEWVLEYDNSFLLAGERGVWTTTTAGVLPRAPELVSLQWAGLNPRGPSEHEGVFVLTREAEEEKSGEETAFWEEQIVNISARQTHGTGTGREGEQSWEHLDELLDLKTKSDGEVPWVSK